jgi:hypothetical protein
MRRKGYISIDEHESILATQRVITDELRDELRTTRIQLADAHNKLLAFIPEAAMDYASLQVSVNESPDAGPRLDNPEAQFEREEAQAVKESQRRLRSVGEDGVPNI